MYSFVFITHGELGNTLLDIASRIMDVDVISGVNLSMVMYSLEHRDDETDFDSMVDGIIRSARQNITGAKQLLAKRESK